MVIAVQDYAPGDVYRVQIRMGDVCGQPQEPKGHAITILVDNEIAAVAGVEAVSPGVGTLWSYISDRIRGMHGKSLIKLTRKMMPIAAREIGLHRIQALVLEDQEEYGRFIKACGFKFEGCLKQSAPDKRDLNIYGRVF